MSDVLSPDGRQVSIGGVDISAVGFGGTIEVHVSGSTGMRAAEDAQPMLVNALSRGAFIEQLTVEISEPRAHPEFLTTDDRGRDAGAEAPEISVTVPEPGTGFGQVLLACDEDGVLTWHFPVDTAQPDIVRRATERNTYRIPANVATVTSGGKRGLVGALGKKLLKVLAFELGDKVLGRVADYFVSRYEQANMPHRLRLITAQNYDKEDVPNMDENDISQFSSGRALLFIHGTASRTHKAFATLPKKFVSGLVKRYEGRVFGFDHPTLSVSPVDNVRWLTEVVGRLPAGLALDVDLVAHSRGGLVGRVICERPFDADLDPDRLHVRKLIMVAAPNAGTPLADREHLGAFLNTLTNMLEFIPDNPATDTLDVLLELLKQVAVGAMGGLEGLKSMDPRGEFLSHSLNQPSWTTTVYHAIAANYEPDRNSPLGRYARDFLTDLVFNDVQNDLVVPTNGVFEANGATTFPIHNVVRLDAADMVDHSGFWTCPAALKAIDDWLIPQITASP